MFRFRNANAGKPDVSTLTEEQLRNWVRDFAGTGWDVEARAELARRGLDA